MADKEVNGTRQMGSTTRRHLLYIAWGYPPSRSSGVYRALATANAFAAAGWEVTVLTATRDSFVGSTGLDESLVARVDPSISIRRVQLNSPVHQNDLRTWPRSRANFPELWSVMRTRMPRRGFPERVFGTWERMLVQAAVEIHETSPIDLVVASASPYVDFAPAIELKKRFGVPFVADYRDAWQLNTFTGERLTTPRSKIARLETELIDRAHEVWFVNEPIRAWHQKLYPADSEKMFVVANGYDAEFAIFESTPHRRGGEGLVFGYIGTMVKATPIRELLAGWRLARRDSPTLADARLRLYGYIEFNGIPSQPMLSLFEGYAADGVEYHGPVNKASISSTYDSFDALVLPLADGEYVTSGKVFEYTATGLPVVSVHDPRSAASSVLADYPQWVAAENLGPASVAAALTGGATLARAQTAATRNAAREWAKPYERTNQLAPRIAALSDYLLKPVAATNA
jgi:glycosyltransferase involved in cell wall biosynthesis